MWSNGPLGGFVGRLQGWRGTRHKYIEKLFSKVYLYMAKKSGTKAKKSTRPHKVSKSRSQKTTSGNKSIEKTYTNTSPSTAGETRGQINLYKFNKGPMPLRLKKTFHFNSFFTQTCAGGLTNNNTIYWSLFSLYDPDYSNAGSQRTTPYWGSWCNSGTTANTYYNYRVLYVEVKVKLMATEINHFPMIVMAANTMGGNSYGNTVYIHSIASRPFHYSTVLEYSGDANWVTKTFRIPMHKVVGCSKRQYLDNPNYLWTFNLTNTTPGWFVMTLGDSMATPDNGDAQTIKGIISIDYHVQLEKPTYIANEI